MVRKQNLAPLAEQLVRLRKFHKNNPDAQLLEHREIIITRLSELIAQRAPPDSIIQTIAKENSWHEGFVVYNLVYLENRGIIKQEEFLKQQPV